MTSFAGNAPAVLLSFLCVLAVGALLVAEKLGAGRAKVFSKSSASVCFVAVALYFSRGPSSLSDRLILCGLVLGAVGDVLLLDRSSAAFLGGLSAFLVGHGAYVVAFCLLVPPSSWTPASLVAVGVFGAAVLVWLLPRLGTMQTPVIVYTIVLCVMVVAAVALPGRVDRGLRIASGAILFAASDLAVARERFVVDTFTNKAWGLPAYYAGQLCLAWSLSAGAS